MTLQLLTIRGIAIGGMLAVLMGGARVPAGELEKARVASLAAHHREPWQRYLDRSARDADRDAAALQAEVAGTGRPAVAAPDGGDFRPPKDADRTWFSSSDAGGLATAVMSFQTPSGGWSKHLGYSRGPRKPGMQWTSQSDPGERPHYQATFDNGATVSEIGFLAGVWEATGREDCRAAVVRGISFVLDAQYPNGGWPQVYPLEGSYHDNITFNDDVMPNVLELLQAVVDQEPRFACLDDAVRTRAAAALDAGIACILATQVVVDGRPTGWCGQYDPLTSEPAAARAYEPVALASIETAHVVRFLMGLPSPSPAVSKAIEHALAWLETAAVTGVAKVKRDGRTIYVTDATASEPLWARFYAVETNQPLFPGKDGVVYASFEAMAAANKTLGYDYFSSRPGSILRTGQKKWRKRLAESQSLR